MKKMRKILASLLTIVFCSLNTVVYAEVDSDSSKKFKEIDIEKYTHFDLGLSGFSLQGRYSYDLTPYNELGLKISFGSFATANASSYLMDTGGDISIEDKAYFIKSSKYYSKDNSVVIDGSYIKAFASLTKSITTPYPPSLPSLPFLAIGTGIGYDIFKNNIGVGIGLDLGSTLQMKNNTLAGIIFFRPELNFKIVF